MATTEPMTTEEIKNTLGITFKRVEKTGTKRDDEIIHNANRFLDAARKNTNENDRWRNFGMYIHALNTLSGHTVDMFDIDDAMHELFREFKKREVV